jgi:hypothetical protein
MTGGSGGTGQLGRNLREFGEDIERSKEGKE